MTARTVADLSTRDIGATMTLAGRGWTITGPLRQVSTETDWIEGQALHQAEAEAVAGRTTTSIQVGPFRAEITNPSAVTVREARP